MKNRLQDTIARYTAKCKQMKAEQRGGKLYELCHRYGGSYYFYYTLLERGYLTGNSDNLKFTGHIPTEKEMKSIVRHGNTLTRNGKTHTKRPRDKYTKRSAYWSKFSERAVDLAIDVTRSITVDICLGAMEREIKAHRSNGSDATHIKNIARISSDLVKLVQ